MEFAIHFKIKGIGILMKIIRGKRSFDLDSFLEKPLFAHLATTSEEGARDSPVWFLWQDNCLWIIGTPEDTFPSRIEKKQELCYRYCRF